LHNLFGMYVLQIVRDWCKCLPMLYTGTAVLAIGMYTWVVWVGHIYIESLL